MTGNLYEFDAFEVWFMTDIQQRAHGMLDMDTIDHLCDLATSEPAEVYERPTEYWAEYLLEWQRKRYEREVAEDDTLH